MHDQLHCVLAVTLGSFHILSILRFLINKMKIVPKVLLRTGYVDICAYLTCDRYSTGLLLPSPLIGRFPEWVWKMREYPQSGSPLETSLYPDLLLSPP